MLEAQPVLVITDIGADIDDTLALFSLLGASKVLKVVGFVTCINNGSKRGALLRGFLRMLGHPDEAFPILPDHDHNTAGCFVPETFPSVEDANLGHKRDTPQRIIDICKEYSEKGVLVLGLAGLSPLAKAIDIDKHQDNVLLTAVKRIYLQGNCRVSRVGDKLRLAPLDIAYNFRVDMEASQKVFDHFQTFTPFIILGKFAAYQVPVTRADFQALTAKLKIVRSSLDAESSTDQPQAVDFLDLVKEQMKSFRAKNSAMFDRIYQVPANLTEEEKNRFSWFDAQNGTFVCSHPYDPLLTLRMIQDVAHQPPCLNSSYSSFYREEVVKNEFDTTHVLLGNDANSNSIANYDLVHQALLTAVARGISIHQDTC